MKLHLISFTVIALLFCAPGIAQQFSKQDKSAIISKALRLIDENYIYPERITVIRQQLQQQIEKGSYDSLHGAADFLSALNTDLEQAVREIESLILEN